MSDGNLHPVMQAAPSPFMPFATPRPHARDNPPWCWCGDRKSPDFGSVFATEGHAGSLVLWFDRGCTQHALTMLRASSVGAEVEIEGRRFDVVRLRSEPGIA